MTREQAIEIINKHFPSSSKGEYRDLREALLMAINSLEAWDRLVKEMEKEIYSYDAFPDIWYGISESFDIIKKHLKEVEE